MIIEVLIGELRPLRLRQYEMTQVQVFRFMSQFRWSDVLELSQIKLPQVKLSQVILSQESG